MKQVYIAGAVRTALGTYGGSLKSVPAHQLGALVVREALNRSGLPDSLVDEVILGRCARVLKPLTSPAVWRWRLACPIQCPDLQ